jgi:hypothetical protein
MLLGKRKQANLQNFGGETSRKWPLGKPRRKFYGNIKML